MKTFLVGILGLLLFTFLETNLPGTQSGVVPRESTCITPEKEKPAPKIERPKEIEIKQGWYACKGTDGGELYHGAATLRKIGEQQYVICWMMEANSASVLGTGFRTDDTLAVGWARGNVVGVTVYQIKADGVLEGNYVLYRTPDGKKQKETLTWEKGFVVKN